MLRRRRLGLAASALLAHLAANSPAIAQDSGPIGFAPASRAAQAKAEAHALAVPTPEKAKAWLRTLTEEPHVAGTKADLDTAVFVRDKLKSWGWTAELAEYEVLLNYPASGPNNPTLEIVRPTPLKLKVTEDAVAVDKDSASPAAFPAFNGYGVSGDVTGQVVYANYGRPDDFAALEKLGVDVRDKLVLVRYGEVFRGLKVLNAQKRGARGILIYSDPADDGYGRGDVYPSGPFRPGSAVQRGSVQFLSLGPGDPSTPDGPSVKGAKRLPFDPLHGFILRDQNLYRSGLDPNVPAAGLPTLAQQRDANDQAVKDWEKQAGRSRDDYFATIPSLPISYDSARPILEALGGPNVPGGWQGGLPLAYHVGPGPAEVRFAIKMDYQVRTIWNVVATLKGEVEPDRWVMIGNHRDAWVYGAVDPSSGTAATLETCRALGEAVKGGWKPRRTIHYASWDAEEYGLVGSTEWADQHAQEVDAKAVMMLNVDSAVSGPEVDLEGVPSLRDLVLEAAESVHDVRTGKPLREIWTAKQRTAWAASPTLDLDDDPWTANGSSHNGNGARPPREFAPRMGPLGSGSDYTAFLDHLGVPAVDIGFAGRYGVYHSIYDDFFWMEKFGDPEFVTHATAARLYTLIAMRAAGAEVVPLRFAAYGEALREYVDDLRRTVARKGRAVDPEAARPAIAFEGLPTLAASVLAFASQAAATDRATEALSRKDGVEPARLAKVNDALTRVERAFLLPSGLPGRPWFKHAIYAPGLTTGYASWPMPGVRQAIIENDAPALAASLPALAARIDAATAALKAVADAAEAPAKPADVPPPSPTT